MIYSLRSIFHKFSHAICNGVLGKTVRIGDQKYRGMRAITNLFAAPSDHEDFLDDIYRAALAIQEGAVLDVGANTGQTLTKMLEIDPLRAYYGFEPQIAAAAAVAHFLVSNKLTQHHILPVALSDKNAILPLQVRGTGQHSLASTVSSVVEGFRPHSFYDSTKYIYAARGDEVIDALNIRGVALLKIDVEGGELEVIRGLSQTLEKHRPLIVFEVLHHFLSVTNEPLNQEMVAFRVTRIRDLEAIIRAQKYDIFHILGHTELRKIDQIQPQAINDLDSTDYLAIPVEHTEKFIACFKDSRLVRN